MKSWRCTNLLIALACAPALLAADWFPLETGNQWVYRGKSGSRVEPLVLRVGDSREVNGHTYYHLEGSPNGSYWLRRDGDRVLEWKESSGDEAVWYDFSKEVGVTYPTARPSTIGVATITSLGASVETPAGSFSKGIALSFGDVRVGNFGGSLTVAEVFADGVGMVTQDLSTSDGTNPKYELVYARIGSATVIKGPENGIQLSINEDKTWARVYADDQQDAAQFLRLYDESGKETWTWSNQQKWFNVCTGNPKYCGTPPDATVALPSLKPGSYVLVAEHGASRVTLPFTVQ
ncbi:hypothetical protein [uncultured Paludibaculum sp.]|uniref:hypothetical protein n=1 Tax=uncultured Paludibaculum sp. TaxID=1765020 RepID=UPI002AAA8DE5|nr:hypothetical protein [uncultured Paludibaculum sp.]